ncbi:MAG: hypothetical protein KDC49_08510 [Saprospiraceae bacterium]|nr:hypothetical protein [Saprospiraceae bacterium]
MKTTIYTTLLIVQAFFLSGMMMAQRPLEVIVNFNTSSFPKEFSAYFNEKSNYTLTLVNYTETEQEVFFLAQLTGINNGVFAQIKEEFRPGIPYVIGPREAKVVTAEELGLIYEGLTLNDLIIEGVPDLSLNGNLPEGEYAFCINAFHFENALQPLSVGCSASFQISYGDQLIITYPSWDEQVVPVQEVHNFTWNYLIDPAILGALDYEFKMIDLTNNVFPDIDEIFKDGGTPDLVSTTTSEPFYIYNGTGTDFPMEEGHLYGIRVRAIDASQGIQMTNDGYSQIRTFWYGYNANEVIIDEDEEEDLSDCEMNCQIDLTQISSTPHADPASLTSIKLGHFTIDQLQLTSTSGSMITGEGEITIPWLNEVSVRVNLDGLKVNSAGIAYAGSAHAVITEASGYQLSDLQQLLTTNGAQLPNDEIKALTENISSEHMIEGLTGDQATTLPLGMRQYLQGQEFTLAFVDMDFYPDRANVSLLNVFNMGAISNEQYLALAGTDICLTPAGLGGEYILHQAGNINFEGFGGTEIVLSGGTGEQINEVCHMEVDCDGIKSFGIHGEIKFPRNVIVPDDEGNGSDGKAKGNFHFNLVRGDEVPPSGDPTGTPQIILGFDMEAFQITGLEGWSIEAASGWLDFSDLENPLDIEFPEGHDLSLESPMIKNTFRGIFLPALSLRLPQEFSIGSRDAVGINNLLFDDTGLSLDVLAVDILEAGNGSLKGWAFTIDTLGLLIVQNQFMNGRMVGAISPPILGESDFLTYRAVIDKNEENKFQFTAMAMPTRLVEVPVAFAKAALCPNSYIKFSLDGPNTTLSTFLKGQMVMSIKDNMPDDLQLDEGTVIPDLNIRLADFQLHYDAEEGFITNNDGTGCSFGFGLDLQDATCGNVFEGDLAEFGFEGYAYDANELSTLLRDGLPENDAASLSPQETMQGFPLSIGDFEVSLNGENAALDFDVELSLMGEDLSFTAGGRLELNSRLALDQNGFKRIKPYNIALECLWLGGTDKNNATGIGLAPFVISGSLCLIDDPDMKGVTGMLNLGMGVINVELMAGFGTQGSPDAGNYGTADYFGWWYLDGIVRMPTIPPAYNIPPFVNLGGLGGGIYMNINYPGEVDIESVMAAGTEAESITKNPQPSFGKKTFKFTTSWTLILDQLLMLDASFAAGFTGNSLSALTLEGELFSLATSYATRRSAPLQGTSRTSMLFQDFDGKTCVAVTGENTIIANIIPGILYGAGPNKELITSTFAIGDERFFPGEESNNDDDQIFWFFNAGNAYVENGMGGVVFDLPGFNLDQSDNKGGSLGIKASAGASMYGMIGQNIPSYLPDPPGNVASLFGDVSGGDDENSGTYSGGNRDDVRDASESSSGKGVVFGAHAYASVGINAVFYANFSIFAGLDIMLKDMSGQACYTSNGRVDNPGVNGWYGQGRAYAGLEGSVGVKGKILGQEINVELMYLAAAMMVSAGGPDPMWLDGRATLTYRLLGGAIKGSARMNISIGEKCTIPLDPSPFDFPIIDSSYPSEEESVDISPYVIPTVNFTIPVNEVITLPYYAPGDIAKTLAYENTISLKAIFEESSFELLTECNNCHIPSQDPDYEILSDDHRIATFNNINAFAGKNGDQGKKKYRMKLTVKAEYKDELDNNKWKRVKVNGQDWTEELDFEFTSTGLSDPMPPEAVTKTKPITGQKFFMQDEMTQKMFVETKLLSEGNDRMYPEKNGISYEYYAIFKLSGAGTFVTEMPLEWDESSQRFKWEAPELRNNEQYIVQLVRRRQANRLQNTGLTDGLRTIIDQNLLSNLESKDVNFEYQVVTDLPLPNPESAVKAGETLIYSFEFATSTHDNLAAKMAESKVEVFESSNYISVQITNTEGFDEFDIYGYTFDEQHNILPRVNIFENFTGGLGGIAKPVLHNFATIWKDEYEDQPNGLEYYVDDSWLDNTPGKFGGQTSGGTVSQIENNVTSVGGTNPPGTMSRGPSAPDYAVTTIEDKFDRLYVNHLDWSQEDLSVDLNDQVLPYLVVYANDDYNALEYLNGQLVAAFQKQMTIKYYLEDYIYEDAQAYIDFAEYQLDVVNCSGLACDPYIQKKTTSQINTMMANMQTAYEAILNSRLYNAGGNFSSSFENYNHLNPGSTNYSQTVNQTNSSFKPEQDKQIHFEANKSFETNKKVAGTSYVKEWK